MIPCSRDAPGLPAVSSRAPARIDRAHRSRCTRLTCLPDPPGAPDLTQGEGSGKSDRALMSARGGLGSMPGLDDQPENEDLIDVLYYIRTFER